MVGTGSYVVLRFVHLTNSRASGITAHSYVVVYPVIEFNMHDEEVGRRYLKIVKRYAAA